MSFFKAIYPLLLKDVDAEHACSRERSQSQPPVHHPFYHRSWDQDVHTRLQVSRDATGENA